MSEVVPARSKRGEVEVRGVRGDLQRFELLIREELASVGLPAEDVFVAVRERSSMLLNMPTLLGTLEPEVLARSFYISKMIAACSVGLFDAALNYLWDELVNELRRRVAGFDLKYFYDIAVPSPDLRKHLRDESDLQRVDDASLLRAAREIGLLTDVGYQRLDHIRFMRNHASAAHPNQVTLTGLDLANWLEICVREVITTPPDTVTATTGRLLANIKKDRLDANAVRDAALFFDQLPPERADTLANGLFGLYTDPERTPVIADNVRTLWPKLWPFVGENARRNFGIRHARARASVETAIATAARELIDLVDGAAYLTEEVRTVEMAEALDELMTAHLGMNNFHAEASHARRLEALTGTQGSIPEAVRNPYARTLVEVFLGNGYGISWAADPSYRRLLQLLDGPAARIALRMFLDLSISSLLSTSKARDQWEDLLDILEPKLTSTSDRNLLAAIRAFTGSPDQLRQDTTIKKLAEPTAG
jgi:hypothetical protein